jgi:hypothetical protein
MVLIVMYLVIREINHDKPDDLKTLSSGVATPEEGKGAAVLRCGERLTCKQ